MDESRRLEQSEVYEFIGRLVQLLDEIHIHQLSEEELQARRDIQSREWLERQAAREDDSEGVPNEQAAERHQ